MRWAKVIAGLAVLGWLALSDAHATPMTFTDVFTAPSVVGTCTSPSPAGAGVRLCVGTPSFGYTHSVLDELSVAGLGLGDIISVLAVDLTFRFWDFNGRVENYTITYDSPSSTVPVSAVAGNSIATVTSFFDVFTALELPALTDGVLNATITRNTGSTGGGLVFLDATMNVTFDILERDGGGVPEPQAFGLLAMTLALASLVLSRRRTTA